MKPEDTEFSKRIRDAVQRGDREIDLGEPGGVPLKMIRTADGDVEVREAGAKAVVRSQVWDPTPTRPTDYPASLPFVPVVRAASVTGGAAQMMGVQWFDPPEPLARLNELVEESVAEGWQLETPPPRIAERPGEHRWLVQGSRVRFFYFVGSGTGGGLLALMQMEHE
jgi:hypothetical protein